MLQSKNTIRKINIGILGCSNIARKHAINAFKKINNVDKIFIASRDSNKAKSWAKEFGIFWKKSYGELIKDTKIDAVYVSLPINLHEEWAIECAKNGKHVICEKSISYNLESVRKIVRAFGKKRLVLFENFMCEYHPQHVKILSLIKKGEIGRPLVLTSHFGFKVQGEDIRLNKHLFTGVFNDAGSYIVFMSRKILDDEPLSVTANFNDLEGSIYMEFPKNKKVFGAFSFDAAYQNSYSVWGSKGLIKTERAYSISPTIDAQISILKTRGRKDTSKEIKIKKTNQFELIFEDFCQAILEKKDEKRLQKYKSIIMQARVMQALRLSNRLSKKIFLKN